MTATFERGVFLPHHKEFTERKPVKTISLPEEIVIPLQQHIGAPCNPLVKAGDKVSTGQKIGESPAFVSAGIHSSVDGTVTAVEPRPHFAGSNVNSVVITPDKEQKEFENKDNDLSKMSADRAKELIKEAGIVGLGGAAFPTHVKLSPPKSIDVLIINACECEPFLTCDHRMLLEMTEEVVEGAKLACKIVGAPKIIIGIETNKSDAADAIRKVISKDKNIEVIMLDVKYPQGSEKQLIKATVNREVPPGKLPFEVGVVVHNVATCIAIYDAVKYEKPLYERVLTVTGDGIANPANIKAPLGTPVGHIIQECGGFKNTDDGSAAKVILGGPMTGFAQNNLSVSTVKGTGGILVFTPAMIGEKEHMPCVRCSRCVQHCPMGLYPNYIGVFGETQQFGKSADWGAMDCFECGVCVYVCPSRRPIVRFVRETKGYMAAKKA